MTLADLKHIVQSKHHGVYYHPEKAIFYHDCPTITNCNHCHFHGREDFYCQITGGSDELPKEHVDYITKYHPELLI